MTAKQRLALVLANLENHYRYCQACGVTGQMCARGESLWGAAIRLHADVLRACVRWHMFHDPGPARLELLRKMRRILRAVGGHV